MSKPNWTMKMTTKPNEGSVEFNITDNHHVDSFYGEWSAKNEDELTYHMDGLKECIDRGTYNNNEMFIDGERIGTWTEFDRKAHNFYHNHPQKKAS